MKNNEHTIFLASKSPRRRKLLNLIYPGISFIDIETPEKLLPSEAPEQAVKRLAAEKMQAAMHSAPRGIVVTADTIVVLDGMILGKPEDEADAVRMLGLLSGRAHFVYTGICVGVAPHGKIISDYVKTRVVFRKISGEEILRYVKSGSPLDKAGAYGIQDDYGAVFVNKISGCYYNVVGLPLSKVHSIIEKVKSGA